MGTSYSWDDSKWMQEEIFTLRTINHWNNLPGEAVDSPMLDTQKAQLDRVLGHLVEVMLCQETLEQMILEVSTKVSILG